YYKNMSNVIDFVDDANIWFNRQIETEVRAGNSWAYGTELFIRKTQGKTTGWISYTLSRVMRKIEGMNENRPYPASYDRPHILNVVLSHDLTKKINISSTFVYGSGRPFTLPVAKYYYDYTAVSYYTSRNGFRLRDYHRMDLA